MGNLFTLQCNRVIRHLSFCFLNCEFLEQISIFHVSGKRPYCFLLIIVICIQDWIWSAGCNPLSITSQGWKLSKFQTDTIARSYILTTLEESIQIVNSAIHLLAMELTCILLVWYSSICIYILKKLTIVANQLSVPLH